MKITRAQLKQIIKEELGDWTRAMQRRARHSPMIAALTAKDPGTHASRERAAQAAEGGLYDIYPKSTSKTATDDPGTEAAWSMLELIMNAYSSLPSNADKELFEDALDKGLGDLMVAWREGREKEAGY